MPDPGILAAVRGEKAIARRIRQIYGKAQKDILSTVQGFNLRFMADEKRMLKKLADKVITEQEYKGWLRRTVFRGKQWDAKANHCAEIMFHANQEAVKIVRGHQISVFAENATYQAYELEKGARMSFGFGIYSPETVTKLLKEQPELLPRKVVNGVKDKAWNKNKISNAITQSIIQGDGIQGIAENIAETLGLQNDDAMMRYARTAITAAQNAGRMEMLHEAEDDGIKVKKKWLASLDNRTRDAHAKLDGQTADIDEPFVVDFNGEMVEIMYPGDPSCDEPGMVYNCRCTLVYEVEEYPIESQRRAYDEWDDEEGHHRESYLIPGNITYREWKEMKRH